MIPDVECLKIISELLTELDMKKFIIKVNHDHIHSYRSYYCKTACVKQAMLITSTLRVDILKLGTAQKAAAIDTNHFMSYC